MADASLAGGASETQRLSRKAILHVGLLLGSLGLVAYLDRISVAFAGPHGMNQDLSLTATAFGFVVGIFTIGYVLFEIPSAGFVTKWGPRRWIVRVMLTWGVIQCLTAFAPNFELMLIGRFMLGVAEAGFTPAVYYLFSKWFIRTYRPLVLVIYSALLGVASVLGPTISGLLVEGGNNLAIASFPGWRFLLFVLGVLAILAAIPARLFIVESPAEARWLTSTEKDRYQAILDADAEQANVPSVSFWQVIKDWRPWVMGTGFFAMFYATYTITVWAPTIVLGFQQQFDTHFTTLQSSLITGIPMFVGVLCAFAAALLAGRTGRSAPLAAAAALIGAVGCISITFAIGPFSTIACLSMVALAGQVGANLFIPIVTRVFAGSGAYAAIALVNSMGAFAGFVSPTVTGWLADLTSNQNSGFYVMSVVLMFGAVVVIFAEQKARNIERSQVTYAV